MLNINQNLIQLFEVQKDQNNEKIKWTETLKKSWKNDSTYLASAFYIRL